MSRFIGNVFKMTLMILTALCFFSSFTYAADSSRWELRINENEVSVYTQQVEGSSIARFKAETLIDADYEEVKQAILDYPSYPLWYENYKSGRIVELQDNETLLVRFVINAPFPIKDRDSVNQVYVEQTDDFIKVRLESRPNMMPHSKKHVRMSVSSGLWELVKTGDQTKVTLIYHADPEIPMPAWIANRYVIAGPANSLRNLKKRIE